MEGIESRDTSAGPRPQVRAQIPTGSLAFDSMLNGGLPIASIMDIYGAAATGKTQFAFQCAVMACNLTESYRTEPVVVFVDCAGSFRPERIAEIAENRGMNSKSILDKISTVSVRSVSEQIAAAYRIRHNNVFSKSRLVIVDDVTSNFTTELNDPEQIIERQTTLASYMRSLAMVATATGMSILLTNAVRSRGDLGVGEATGEIISEYSLFRLFFKREDRRRIASIEEPLLLRKTTSFEIEANGIP